MVGRVFFKIQNLDFQFLISIINLDTIIFQIGSVDLLVLEVFHKAEPQQIVEEQQAVEVIIGVQDENLEENNDKGDICTIFYCLGVLYKSIYFSVQVDFL